MATAPVPAAAALERVVVAVAAVALEHRSLEAVAAEVEADPVEGREGLVQANALQDRLHGLGGDVDSVKHRGGHGAVGFHAAGLDVVEGPGDDPDHVLVGNLGRLQDTLGILQEPGDFVPCDGPLLAGCGQGLSGLVEAESLGAGEDGGGLEILILSRGDQKNLFGVGVLQGRGQCELGSLTRGQEVQAAVRTLLASSRSLER